MTIKIILIDDHTLFRSGIKALLSRQSSNPTSSYSTLTCPS